MLNRRVLILTIAVVALATTITTHTFAQDRGTDAPPAASAKAGATQDSFTTSGAIPWKPIDPKKYPGLQNLPGVGESKPGRLGIPATVSCGHGLGLALAHCGV